MALPRPSERSNPPATTRPALGAARRDGIGNDAAVQLPDPVAVGDDMLAAIAARHELNAERVEPLPSAGIINSVNALGDYVLRIPRDHPAHIAPSG